MSSSEFIDDGNITGQEETAITLPVQNKELGTFLCGLLGQPQSVEQEFTHSFNIDHEWLLNLHEVINQRVHQQAHAHLLNFKAVIYFKNKMKRTLTTVEAFQTYKEMQQQCSIGVQIEWSYLIQFPNSKVPEKQLISFIARSESLPTPKKTMPSEDPVLRLLYRTRGYREANYIHYRIDYTERTWANDIENLLSDTITTSARQEFQSHRYGWMQFGLFVAIVASFVFISDRIFEYYQLIWSSEIENALEGIKQHNSATLEAINSKLVRIGEIFLSGIDAEKPNGSIYAAGAMFGILIGFIFVELTEYRERSFLVLSKKAEERKKQIIAKEKRNVLSLIWGYIAAISSSVLAGFVYAYIT
ncbi:hypothetical protein ACFL0R_07675 [Pseudomonadota bacterium]